MQGDALQQEMLPRCEMMMLHFEMLWREAATLCRGRDFAGGENILEKLRKRHHREGRWMEWQQGGEGSGTL